MWHVTNRLLRDQTFLCAWHDCQSFHNPVSRWLTIILPNMCGHLKVTPLVHRPYSPSHLTLVSVVVLWSVVSLSWLGSWKKQTTMLCRDEFHLCCSRITWPLEEVNSTNVQKKILFVAYKCQLVKFFFLFSLEFNFTSYIHSAVKNFLPCTYVKALT